MRNLNLTASPLFKKNVRDVSLRPPRPRGTVARSLCRVLRARSRLNCATAARGSARAAPPLHSACARAHLEFFSIRKTRRERGVGGARGADACSASPPARARSRSCSQVRVSGIFPPGLAAMDQVKKLSRTGNVIKIILLVTNALVMVTCRREAARARFDGAGARFPPCGIFSSC